MPNLGAVLADSASLNNSIERMCNLQISRSDAQMNRGIRSPEELQAHVCQQPFVQDDVAALQAVIDKMHSRNG